MRYNGALRDEGLGVVAKAREVSSDTKHLTERLALDKPARLKNPAYLDYIRGKDCLACRAPAPCPPHHEPTTGLSGEDVGKLVDVLGRLVDAGNTVLVVEHNLDVIRVADWVIDLGPGAGTRGGEVVAMGRPETVASIPESATGRYLADAMRAAGDASGAGRD